MKLITIHNPISVHLMRDLMERLMYHKLDAYQVISDAEGIHIGTDFDKEPAMRRVTEEDYELIKLAKIRAGEFVPVPDDPFYPPQHVPSAPDDIKAGVKFANAAQEFFGDFFHPAKSVSEMNYDGPPPPPEKKEKLPHLPAYPQEFSAWIASVKEKGGPWEAFLGLFNPIDWDTYTNIDHPGKRGIDVSELASMKLNYEELEEQYPWPPKSPQPQSPDQ